MRSDSPGGFLNGLAVAVAQHQDEPGAQLGAAEFHAPHDAALGLGESVSRREPRVVQAQAEGP